MVVASRLERMVRYVRRWRSGSDDGGLDLAPHLPDNDLRKLRRLIDESVEGRGGEVAARRKARSIGATVSRLDTRGRRRFFELLDAEYGVDESEVDTGIDTVIRARGPDERRDAESGLRRALEPRRERLLRSFAGLDDGIPFLVELREDLLGHLRGGAALESVDNDLNRILAGWFDVALLQLQRITWDSPAALLERLIEYEAVHAIESWDDLKGRLGPARRCYAFLHPTMPADPLIFVEVALTRGIADSLQPLLDHEAEQLDPGEADTAIFYSISNCHQGLAGVRMGDFLIKSVVEQLSRDLPNLRNFATLSPLPGFRRWLEESIANGNLQLSDDEAAALAPSAPETGAAVFAGLVQGGVPSADDALLRAAQPLLMSLAADYLLRARRHDRARDPVAHFHLSNGATVDQLNWWANPSAAGWERGLSIMVNYGYHLNSIERNHDRYVGEGEIGSSDRVRQLLRPRDPDRD